jgi:hypothetical protein
MMVLLSEASSHNPKKMFTPTINEQFDYEELDEERYESTDN